MSAAAGAIGLGACFILALIWTAVIARWAYRAGYGDAENVGRIKGRNDSAKAYGRRLLDLEGRMERLEDARKHEAS